jgi:prevent-host-death family protein
MKIATASDVKANFSAYLKASEQSPVVITRKGKPVAVLVRAGEEDDLERLLMAHSPRLQAILESARQRFRAGAGIPHETFWQEVEADAEGQSKKRGKNGSAKR